MIPKQIDFRLYLITDRKLLTSPDALPAAVEESLKGGARAVQLREKDIGVRELLGMAYSLREITKRYKARLFINGRVDVAMAVGAEGVHLGISDIPVHAARKAAGNDMLIGASAHSVAEAKRAEQEGADFVTFGPVYKTPSKLQYGKPVGVQAIERVKEEVSIPVFAIGGINRERVGEALKAGAYGVALISAILASENIKSSTEEFMRLLK
ncbi:putative thiamine-phosphate synthase [Candidatus Sulfobium mesophilum]|uniref:Thiamine-phosphate synthase n=1 Tax=Candidatus Sulfobium mesophilum TaxID=2016548 RepID=A0A2U3QET4_9BACT|nr:putative thiamine-phosphate synthase [Candidatus Sulfobium mesophilum]